MTAPAVARGMVSVGMAKNGASPANGPGMARHRNAYESQKECSLSKTLAMRDAPPHGINESRVTPSFAGPVRMPRQHHHDDGGDRVRNGEQQAGFQAREIVAAAPEPFREKRIAAVGRGIVEETNRQHDKTAGCRQARPTEIFLAGSSSPASRCNVVSRKSLSSREIHFASRGWSLMK